MLMAATCFSSSSHSVWLTLEVERTQVFIQVRNLGGAGNRDDPIGLVEHPQQRDLRGGHPVRAAEVIERFNDTVIGTQRLRCKTRQRRTVVVGFVELRVFVDGASKKTSIERTVGGTLWFPVRAT